MKKRLFLASKQPPQISKGNEHNKENEVNQNVNFENGSAKLPTPMEITLPQSPPLEFEKLVDLPNEIILVMATFLKPKDLCSFALSARRFHDLSKANILWYNFASIRWGETRSLKKDVVKYDGSYRELLHDLNARNVFYFDSRLCPRVELSQNNTVAHSERIDNDCILLTHRGLTSGCYTFKVRIDGKGSDLPLFLGFGAFVRATIGITYDSITASGWRSQYLIAYYFADMILHNTLDHSQVEARSNLDEKGIQFGDTVSAVVNLIDATNNTIRFYHNDKSIGEEGCVKFNREDPDKPIYFFFRLGDGECQTAEIIQSAELDP